MKKRDFSTASRAEINIQLNATEGQIPNDMHGVAFINSACGTINSNGLPYQPKNPDGTNNQEYGSPLINGDSLMIRVDFSEAGHVGVKTGILKAPCYFADVATSPQVSPGNPWEDLHFKNMGLARISMKLGTRNELNTAITPVKFKADDAYRLLATFDAGRPFEFDPQKLEILTAIGENKIWHSGLPPFLDQPLAMVLTTAHPVFDPYTEELFTVNFTKTDKQLMEATHIFEVMFHDGDWFKKELKKLISWLEGKDHHEKIRHTESFLKEIHLRAPHRNKGLSSKLGNWLKRLWNKFFYTKMSNVNAVKVLKWKGEKSLGEWTIVHEDGSPIAIDYNMHQIGFSKDYLVLCDTNFKFTLDVMINFPFQEDPVIDQFIRALLSGAMNDYSTLYLVKRADLTSSVKTVKASQTRLPVETVHFSVNYQNPNDVLTIHTAHNCSACPAEWLRSYDSLIAAPNESVNPEKIGLIAVGEMDIGKVGKVVVNAQSGELLPETKFLHLTGEENGSISGAHTWAVGLYTYNHMLSPDTNVDEISHVYWQSYGLREDSLTRYIYNLYKDPKRHRTFSAEQMLNYTKMGARFLLQCIETEGLTSTDHYTFAEEQYFWSLQFIPRKTASPGIPESKNGYILTTVITGEPIEAGKFNYVCEMWLFDANNLAAGPVSKMSHPELSIGFTIHSVWVPVASEVPLPSYKLNVKEDYDDMIRQVTDKKLQKRVQELFDQKVYPYFTD